MSLRTPKPKPHPPHPPKPPHPHHSGDFVFEGDQHYHAHLHAGDQSALEGCLRLIRGLPTRQEREAVLGRLLATLLHEQAIGGLISTWSKAMAAVDHYNHPVETRHL